MRTLLLSGFALSLFLPVAYGKGEVDEDMARPNIVYRKKTEVVFSDAVVEGGGDNPEGVYIVTPPDKQFGSLLKLRPNFHRELIRDSLLLK